MLLKDIPTKRKEVILYKIQVQDMFFWHELKKVYATLDKAISKVPKDKEARVVKRTNKGWEIVWSKK